MRLYSFQNFYLAGIHAGIQTAHTVARMSQKYAQTPAFTSTASENELRAAALFNDWARRGGEETIIIKNGGMQCNLEDTLAVFQSVEHNYPFDYFHEAQEALGGAMTNVSIVVPTHIWKLADQLRRLPTGYDSYAYSRIDGEMYYLVDTATMAPITGLTIEEQHSLANAITLPKINSAAFKAVMPEVVGEVELVKVTQFDKGLISIMNSCSLM